MNSFRIFCWTMLLSLSVQAADSAGTGGKFNPGQKATQKSGSRWTLQEWMEQKQRNQLMDLWLGMYAPSPYEFFLSGSYNSFSTDYHSTTNPAQTFNSYSSELGLYATVVGLEGRYENNTAEKYSDLSGAIHLRVMGNSVQGTHLILFYGQRSRDGEWQGSRFRVTNPMAGADLNIYLTKFFGISGRYSSFQSTQAENVGDISGSRTEAGAFLDFEALRIFGNWFHDAQKNENAGLTLITDRVGYQTGLKFFF